MGRKRARDGREGEEEKRLSAEPGEEGRECKVGPRVNKKR